MLWKNELTTTSYYETLMRLQLTRGKYRGQTQRRHKNEFTSHRKYNKMICGRDMYYGDLMLAAVSDTRAHYSRRERRLLCVRVDFCQNHQVYKRYPLFFLFLLFLQQQWSVLFVLYTYSRVLFNHVLLRHLVWINRNALAFFFFF